MEFVATAHATLGSANVKGDEGSDGSDSITHVSAVHGSAKRRKVDVSIRRSVHESGEASADSACVVQCNRCEVAEAEVNSAADRGEDVSCVRVDEDDPGSTSCCSGNDSTEGDEKTREPLDLESAAENSGFGIPPGKREEDGTITTQGRQLLPHSGLERQPQDELAGPVEDNATNPPAHGRRFRETMPTQGEIDDFFSATNTSLGLGFKEKYNFDFDKGEPLEGRYEWRAINSR